MLVAIATSAALFVDYVSSSPAFCSPGSGCSAVRASRYSHFQGIPLPEVLTKEAVRKALAAAGP